MTLSRPAAPPIGRSRAAVVMAFIVCGMMFGSWASRIPAIKEQAGLDSVQLGFALLGSPLGPSRFARWLRNNPVFRALTRDAGDLLGSPERMARIGPASVPTTAVVGTGGLHRALSPFGDEVSDGIVALSEVSAEWLPDQVLIPVSHTVLPASRRVARIVLQRLDWPD